MLSAIAVFGQSEPHGLSGGAACAAPQLARDSVAWYGGCMYPYTWWVHGACTWVHMVHIWMYIWVHMAKYSQIWPNTAKYRPKYGQIQLKWLNMAKIGHSGIRAP